MAQSRIKKLEKMTLIDPVSTDTEFTFTFPPASVSNDAGHLVEMKNVYFGYSPESEYILDGINFHIAKGAKIAVIGANSSGKSTLMKLISGQLQPTSGQLVTKCSPDNTAIYHQHFADQLNLNETPMNYISNLHPAADLLDIRAHLGKFGISGDQTVRPISTFSGGECARIVMASITFQRSPRFLILDELTNYLCVNSISALITCLDEYDGTMVCVSHNRFFWRLSQLSCG
ncbi:hypothetical protein GEMRC1_005064 [Eukaryota sp. GEM-RC1]